MSNSTPKILKNSFYIILFLVLIGYVFYNSRIFIAGPQIEIIEPQNGSTIQNDPLIRIKGTATNIAFINLNDRAINIDENSFFDEPVLLYPGYNIIKVDATDKFERMIEKQIEIIYFEEGYSENIDEPDIIIDATSSTSSLEEI